MAESRVFPLRPFPRRLLRSLLTFAGAGSLMAFVVWSDGMGGPWLPLVILVACWGIPALFAFQIWRGGFDPLQRFVATEQGLEAHYRGGDSRFFAWDAITQLVIVEGFRNKAWAIISGQGTMRWFGELEELDAFERLVAERSGKEWVSESRFPDAAF